jgi:polysaccharide export outer membrane protein
MTTVHLAVILCFFLGTGNQAPAHQQAVASAGIPADSAPTSKPAATPVLPASDPDYKIGSLDVLRVDVWKETEISRVVPVRPDGKISLPLLNDLQAAGLTTVQLSKMIADGLKEYITNPQVTVTVNEINSRRVYITGEVTHPGALSLLPHMTVLQALSSTGGFTLFAKIKDIYVLRTENGKKVQHPFNYKDVVKGKAQDQDIELQPGDVIVVP